MTLSPFNQRGAVEESPLPEYYFSTCAELLRCSCIGPVCHDWRYIARALRRLRRPDHLM